MDKTMKELAMSLLKAERKRLRTRLKNYFTQPVAQRNYEEFESIVDKMESVREEIRVMRIREYKIRG